MSVTWCAVVVAAGRGTRFGRPKQLIEIAGKPMLAWSIETLASIPQIERLVVTTEPENAFAVEGLVARAAPRLPRWIIPGGAERQDSVRLALGSLAKWTAPDVFVLVHDGARPLVRADDIRRGMEVSETGCAALLAAPVVDTIKQTDESGRVMHTHDRTHLWAAQTPQFGRLDDFLRAHRDAQRHDVHATDDASLLERIGVEVRVVQGSAENFKVTVPSDLERAELILRDRAAV